MTDGRSGSSMSQRNASKVCIWDSPLCVCDSVTLGKPLSILELPFIMDNTIIIHRIFFFPEISKWQHILNKVCHYFFWRLFLMWTICVKSLLILLQHCFCFMFWCFGPKACRILPTRGRTCTLCTRRWSLNPWTTRKVSVNTFIFFNWILPCLFWITIISLIVWTYSKGEVSFRVLKELAWGGGTSHLRLEK